MTELVASFIETPVGRLRLVANERALVAVQFPRDHDDEIPVVKNHPVLTQTRRELEEYFAGKRTVFTVRLEAHGTPFQRKVWNALSAIPFGETCSYGDIARAVGSAGAVRAVGSANGKNPHAIIVPCHRVIQTGGALGGYGGGLPQKVWLLDLEKSWPKKVNANRSRTRSSARGSEGTARQ